ncbi:MAG: hypothetical protein ACOYD4_03975 [Solirubrobacterales bacterium]
MSDSKKMPKLFEKIRLATASGILPKPSGEDKSMPNPDWKSAPFEMTIGTMGPDGKIKMAQMKEPDTGVQGCQLNELHFAEFIKAKAPKKLRQEWVLWMLQQIADANHRKAIINPKWLEASHNVTKMDVGAGFGMPSGEPSWK